MSIENLSFSAAENGIERFEGKQHIIAGLALSSVFESREDIYDAFSELSE